MKTLLIILVMVLFMACTESPVEPPISIEERYINILTREGCWVLNGGEEILYLIFYNNGKGEIKLIDSGQIVEFEWKMFQKIKYDRWYEIDVKTYLNMKDLETTEIWKLEILFLNNDKLILNDLLVNETFTFTFKCVIY
jgi:hypothetical protein